MRVVPGTRIRSLALGAAIASAAALFLAAGPAQAHDTLRSSTPRDGSTVATAPAEIALTFDRSVLTIGAGVRVEGPDGDVQVGKPQIKDGVVTQALSPDAPAGSYTVTWRVTSSDGHPISGEVDFEATAASGVAASQPANSNPSSISTPTGSATPATATADDGSSPWRAMLFPGIAGALVGVLWVLINRRRQAAKS